MNWAPATKEEVLACIDREWVGIDPALRTALEGYFVEPYLVSWDRYGEVMRAFVVARIGKLVVFFDDIEEDFGTAKEVDGCLLQAAFYGGIVLALRELQRLGTNV